ncbi:MAG: hypothetical protein GTN76_09165 [Candidatus Aenigmarchaeota archaeon]|nr:hypothetical protein [Candidatus Aenigmarchaeota archaeon]
MGRSRNKIEISVEGMDAKRALGYVGVIVLLFFGIIFLIASAYAITRLYVGIGLIAVSMILIYYLRRPSKIEITERREVDLSGKVTLQPVRCPNCGANVDLKSLEVKHGVPSLKCPYCGKAFEVAEEPKW